MPFRPSICEYGSHCFWNSAAFWKRLVKSPSLRFRTSSNRGCSSSGTSVRYCALGFSVAPWPSGGCAPSAAAPPWSLIRAGLLRLSAVGGVLCRLLARGGCSRGLGGTVLVLGAGVTLRGLHPGAVVAVHRPGAVL